VGWSWLGTVADQSNTGATSWSVKGVVSDDVPVYSPGRRRKKNARQIMSAMAWVSRVADGCAARAATWRRI
jgi:hypothetical protein